MVFGPQKVLFIEASMRPYWFTSQLTEGAFKACLPGFIELTSSLWFTDSHRYEGGFVWGPEKKSPRDERANQESKRCHL